MQYIINDKEFGEIKVRKLAGATHLKLKFSSRGRISASVPIFSLKRDLVSFIDRSREALRQQLDIKPTKTYSDGDRIGKWHTVMFVNGKSLAARLRGRSLAIILSPGMDPNGQAVQDLIKHKEPEVLKTEAKEYLAKRLEWFATSFGFSYERLRFGNPGTRWGSCSSSGTISLNIGLMRLDDRLIDYVIVHELCHTRQMNHSATFWREVETILPSYKQLRKDIKQYQP